MKRLVVPVDLGGSPTACAVRSPLRGPPAPETVEALIDHYLTERHPGGDAQAEVAFFHGGLPSDVLLEVCRPHPVRVACSPADLSRAGARRLQAGGVTTIEIELLTFCSDVLRGCSRGYTPGRVRAMLTGLGSLGFRRGGVLVSGLPGSSHHSAVSDARVLAGDGRDGARVEFARLLPALAFEGSKLAVWHAQQRWKPMSLGEAVTTTLEQVLVLESAGVEVARVGVQPGQDLSVKVVGGPVHPNLRALVEVRRFRGLMAAALASLPSERSAAVLVNPKDLSWAKGTANENLRALRAALGRPDLEVRPDEQVARGTVAVAS